MRLTLLRSTVVAAALLVLVASAAVAPASAGGAPSHCVNPHGLDLNEFHTTEDRVITPFCTEALAGEKWVPTTVWITNTSHEAIPAGYVPVAPTPIDDFNAKVVSVRYVIDAGTRQARTYTFPASEVLETGLVFPDGDLPTMGFKAVFRPLSVGSHAVDMFVTMSADHWDGFDVDPLANLVPAGEVHWLHYDFSVKPRR